MSKFCQETYATHTVCQSQDRDHTGGTIDMVEKCQILARASESVIPKGGMAFGKKRGISTTKEAGYVPSNLDS